MQKVLSIAGFDGSGGAGIQADLKTFSALGCYGMTVLTALPIQNTTGVKACYEISTQAILEQLQAIFIDIRPDAIKIGMLFNAEIIELVADFLLQHASGIPIVLDPVMAAKNGNALLLPDAVDSLKSKIIPLATIITPNLSEAEVLAELQISNHQEMEVAAQKILGLGSAAVLLKGGHLNSHQASDLYLHTDGVKEWLETEKIVTYNTHGTGCALSAAIAACLSLGMDLLTSCQFAKRYLTNALQAACHQKIGQGAGPVHYFYHLWPTIDKI